MLTQMLDKSEVGNIKISMLRQSLYMKEMENAKNVTRTFRKYSSGHEVYFETLPMCCGNHQAKLTNSSASGV